MLAGDVVEMATGEGKTLAGAIAAAGYALGGRHVHVVTINDYLARRDAEWMGPLLEALGLTVGWVTGESTAEERRAAYTCDVTYASVNEIGFDVLRDQLVTDVDDLVSPNPDVALIDEADSVLVDEALVPLVLAGTSHREQPRLEIIRLVGRVAGRRGLRHRLRQPQRPPHRRRRPQTRKAARRNRPVLRGTRRHHADRGQRRAARARAVAPRRALHRARRRRAPDQRLPRPHRAAAALARRPAGGGRGQGGHRDHRDRRGARHHHRAGADQPLPDGVRHDRHRVGRRRTAAPVLQARGVTDRRRTRRTSATTRPTGSTSPPPRRTTRSSPTSSRCTRPGSRSWSAPTTSPNPRSCTSGCSAAACPRWCSTPRTTPRRPRSSPRPASSARSRCRPRWPAAAPTSGSADPTRADHERGGRARRTACGRHRPAPHRAAGQPAARSRRPPG